MQFLHQPDSVQREHHEVDEGNIIFEFAGKVPIDLLQRLLGLFKAMYS